MWPSAPLVSRAAVGVTLSSGVEGISGSVESILGSVEGILVDLLSALATTVTDA